MYPYKARGLIRIELSYCTIKIAFKLEIAPVVTKCVYGKNTRFTAVVF